jgi:hypothetical protein
MRERLMQRWEIMGWRQSGKFLRKAWLLKRQMAQDINKEGLLVGVVAIKRLPGGNPRLRQDSINAGRQVSLLEKQSVGSHAESFSGLLGASGLSVLHSSSSWFQ